MVMNSKYFVTKTSVSYIRYHLVFCSRYRRKIFRIPGVTERFLELVTEECRSKGIELLHIECELDHVYLHVSVPPTISIQNILAYIKGVCAPMRNEFPELSSMPALWTKNFFVSTEEYVSPTIIQNYVESQKLFPLDHKRDGIMKM